MKCSVKSLPILQKASFATSTRVISSINSNKGALQSWKRLLPIVSLCL